MNKLDPKEEIFKTKMEDFAPLPPTMVWENVSQSIRNKKRRRLFWLWIPILLTLTGALFYKHHYSNIATSKTDTQWAAENNFSTNKNDHYEQNTDPTLSNANQNDHELTIEPQSTKVINELSNQAAAPDVNHSISNNFQSKKNISQRHSSAPYQSNQSLRNNKKQSGSTINQPEVSINKTELFNQRVGTVSHKTKDHLMLEKNDIKNSEAPMSKRGNSNQNPISTDKQAENHLLNNSSSRNPNHISQKENILNPHYLQLLPLLEKSESYLIPARIPDYPEVVTTMTNRNKKTKLRNSFNIELFGGIGFPIKNTSYAGRITSYPASVKSTESPWYTLSAGLYAGYVFKNKFSIYTGIDYLMIVENFKYENNTKLKYFTAPNAFNLSTGWYSGVETTVGDIRYNLLSIPVQVGYQFSHAHWTIEPRIGINYNFLTQSEGFILNPEGNVSKREENNPKISKLGLSYTLAANIEYSTDKHIGFFVRPQFNLLQNKFDFAPQSLKVGYSIPDLRVGIRYRF